MSAEPLPIQKIADIVEEEGVPWLIEGLWMQSGVGFLGGCPKACKSWLALDLALSVATGTQALGRYAVAGPAAVLLFAAEDAPAMVRSRLAGIAHHRGLALDDVPIHLVLASSLRLEIPGDQARLEATVVHTQPRLVILDPFVRLSRADENSAQEVSAVLAFLRELQRKHHVAILIVHHTRKQAGRGSPAGLALRGSGDFWAWADTTLSLHRDQRTLQLRAEHRNAAPGDPVRLELWDEGDHGPSLRVCDGPPDPQSTDVPLEQRILDALEDGVPCKTRELRGRLQIRMQTLLDTLRELERDGKVQKGEDGWHVTTASTSNTATPDTLEETPVLFD